MQRTTNAKPVPPNPLSLLAAYAVAAILLSLLVAGCTKDQPTAPKTCPDALTDTSLALKSTTAMATLAFDSCGQVAEYAVAVDSAYVAWWDSTLAAEVAAAVDSTRDQILLDKSLTRKQRKALKKAAKRAHELEKLRVKQAATVAKAQARADGKAGKAAAKGKATFWQRLKAWLLGFVPGLVIGGIVVWLVPVFLRR